MFGGGGSTGRFIDSNSACERKRGCGRRGGGTGGKREVVPSSWPVRADVRQTFLNVNSTFPQTNLTIFYIPTWRTNLSHSVTVVK